MKKILSLSILIFGFYSLKAQINIGEISSNKIAKLMKDSLLLNDVQKQHIYDVNIQIYQQKQQIRQKYRYSDSLAYFMKMTELKKDSLYQSILPSDKYAIYEQKKILLTLSN